MSLQDKTIKVLAKMGKKGVPISRLEDGKVILFSDTDPLTPYIKEGDIVEGKIVKDADSYAVMRALNIETPEAESNPNSPLPLAGIAEVTLRDGVVEITLLKDGSEIILIPTEDFAEKLQPYLSKKFWITLQEVIT